MKDDFQEALDAVHKDVMNSCSLTVEGFMEHFGLEYEDILQLVHDGKLERTDVFGLETYRPRGGWGQ